ncbi:Glycosyltransferase [Heracleum sosnowskyi]|uniref:Glycosyltransferase n=1 Tax=Heracleum sosnowskyi TaxID=360622 RepID=A0AAD8HDE6_9APIA|nr:Glycosyltransferase [Heracleum sosnowskyi]
MSISLHQRTLPTTLTDPYPKSPKFSQKPGSFLTRNNLLALFSLLIILGFLFPYISTTTPSSLFFSNSKIFESKWRAYTLSEAVAFVGTNGTVIVCAVSQPYLPFLNNWLISIVKQKHQDKVLVIAEDYVTLFKVNERWPGHAVLVPPAPDAQVAHKFGSQGFFNFTSRRPRHLLQILELGYNVMYNDVDMVWLADPFPYLQGKHDVYFMDDMIAVKPLNHSNALPPPGKKGRPYICSCMIYMRPTTGAKLVMKKWIEELQDQPWSKAKKANDQPGFNWALQKTAEQVDLYLLPQAAFPTGGLYFKNRTWVKETKGMQVIIHNNYIVGFEKKIKRFKEYGLWLVDDNASESPLGEIS